jgi:hypothetical protein
MAFTNLTQLTQAQYQALRLTPIGSVSVSSTGSPDTRVGIQLGGWDGNDVIAFTVTNAANSGSGTSIDSRNANTIDVNVSINTNPSAVVSYWTVNVGTDNRTSQWVINFQVQNNNSDTGTWVFAKGSGDDDVYSHHIRYA